MSQMQPRWKHHTETAVFVSQYQEVDIWVSKATISLRFGDGFNNFYRGDIKIKEAWFKPNKELPPSHPFPYLHKAYAVGFDYIEGNLDPSVSPNARSS